MALGAWKTIVDQGRRVPSDVALVGFDDIELLAQAEVPLTTVRQPRYQMGRQAVEVLVRLLDSTVTGRAVTTLPVQLIARGSCGAQPTIGRGTLTGLKTS